MTDFIKLNGHDSSVLCFIARFRSSDEAAAQAERLTGEARNIADAILNPDHDHDASIRAAAVAFIKWADPNVFAGIAKAIHEELAA